MAERGQGYNNVVSILILLEVILEDIVSMDLEAEDFSFNPYFTGSNSGSLVLVKFCSPETGFNPYFTGSNSGSRTAQTPLCGVHCFNPYFTGSNSGSVRTYAIQEITC